jgi:hypothetical protein
MSTSMDFKEYLVSYKTYHDTYRNTYQISRYISLVEKVYRYTPRCNAFRNVMPKRLMWSQMHVSLIKYAQLHDIAEMLIKLALNANQSIKYACHNVQLCEKFVSFIPIWLLV